jgi:hypothetical protein
LRLYDQYTVRTTPLEAEVVSISVGKESRSALFSGDGYWLLFRSRLHSSYQLNSSSSAVASCKSFVSIPSVNQPELPANIRRAASFLPCYCHSWLACCRWPSQDLQCPPDGRRDNATRGQVVQAPRESSRRAAQSSNLQRNIHVRDVCPAA